MAHPVARNDMLQLRTAGYLALDNLRARGEFPPRWNSIDELEEVTDRFMQQFMQARLEASKTLGPGFQMLEILDSAVRSSETEKMDAETTPGPQKLEMVRALDRMNEMTLAYRHQVDMLLPIIGELSRLKPGPVRVLELACGSGGLAFTLAGLARHKEIEITVTASDILAETVDEGRRRAMEKSLPLEFIVMNAFDFEGVEQDSIDLVMISQSMHHFSPGQFALMIARAKSRGATAFVGIDGHRSLLLLAGVPLVASLQGSDAFTSDGLTSARKFYSELELEIIAEIATGRRAHRVECSWPMSLMDIRFERNSH